MVKAPVPSTGRTKYLSDFYRLHIAEHEGVVDRNCHQVSSFSADSQATKTIGRDKPPNVILYLVQDRFIAAIFEYFLTSSSLMGCEFYLRLPRLNAFSSNEVRLTPRLFAIGFSPTDEDEVTRVELLRE